MRWMAKIWDLFSIYFFHHILEGLSSPNPPFILTSLGKRIVNYVWICLIKREFLLTMLLSNLQQDGFPQVDGEGLVLLIFLIINNLHLKHLPVQDRDQVQSWIRQTLTLACWARKHLLKIFGLKHDEIITKMNKDSSHFSWTRVKLMNVTRSFYITFLYLELEKKITCTCILLFINLSLRNIYWLAKNICW